MNSPKEFASRFLNPCAVRIGSTGSYFYLSKAVLTSRCPYLSKLISTSELNEHARALGLSSDLTLPESIDVDAFQAFIQYIYTGNYKDESDTSEVVSARRVEQCVKLQVGVYLLAERFLMENLKAVALSKMKRALGKCYDFVEGRKIKNVKGVRREPVERVVEVKEEPVGRVMEAKKSGVPLSEEMPVEMPVKKKTAVVRLPPTEPLGSTTNDNAGNTEPKTSNAFIFGSPAKNADASNSATHTDTAASASPIKIPADTNTTPPTATATATTAAPAPIPLRIFDERLLANTTPHDKARDDPSRFSGTQAPPVSIPSSLTAARAGTISSLDTFGLTPSAKPFIFRASPVATPTTTSPPPPTAESGPSTNATNKKPTITTALSNMQCVLTQSIIFPHTQANAMGSSPLPAQGPNRPLLSTPFLISLTKRIYNNTPSTIPMNPNGSISSAFVKVCHPLRAVLVQYLASVFGTLKEDEGFCELMAGKEGEDGEDGKSSKGWSGAGDFVRDLMMALPKGGVCEAPRVSRK